MMGGGGVHDCTGLVLVFESLFAVMQFNSICMVFARAVQLYVYAST